mmetsp:Transcript_33778/g.88758  ORF Transcript_33778/g.88758 Transcript_33778/m.88758 type:complete len:269 (-) Transcript_33778:1045-1851(-)
MLVHLEDDRRRQESCIDRKEQLREQPIRVEVAAQDVQRHETEYCQEEVRRHKKLQFVRSRLEGDRLTARPNDVQVRAPNANQHVESWSSETRRRSHRWKAAASNRDVGRKVPHRVSEPHDQQPNQRVAHPAQDSKRREQIDGGIGHNVDPHHRHHESGERQPAVDRGGAGPREAQQREEPQQATEQQRDSPVGDRAKAIAVGLCEKEHRDGCQHHLYRKERATPRCFVLGGDDWRGQLECQQQGRSKHHKGLGWARRGLPALQIDRRG